MPRLGVQRKLAAAALSQAGRAGPDQPKCAMQPVGRCPDIRDRRQTASSFSAPAQMLADIFLVICMLKAKSHQSRRLKAWSKTRVFDQALILLDRVSTSSELFVSKTWSKAC